MDPPAQPPAGEVRRLFWGTPGLACSASPGALRPGPARAGPHSLSRPANSALGPRRPSRLHPPAGSLTDAVVAPLALPLNPYDRRPLQSVWEEGVPRPWKGRWAARVTDACYPHFLMFPNAPSARPSPETRSNSFPRRSPAGLPAASHAPHPTPEVSLRLESRACLGGLRDTGVLVGSARAALPRTPNSSDPSGDPCAGHVQEPGSGMD